MRGIVGRYSPEEFCNLFLYKHREEMKDWGFSCYWGYISETEIRIKIYSFLKDVPEHEQSFKEITIEVPRTINSEIWSRIELIDNQLYEGFMYKEQGNTVMDALSKGYEDILEKLNRNFKEGILDEFKFNESVRILKGLRLQQILQ
ncbi:hypothetical protein PDK93_25335 [Bacillus cereus]|nr:hypothetical protein [Bacillus cereus]